MIPVSFALAADGSISDFRGPLPDLTQPLFPIRGAFFYPWFPENWGRPARCIPRVSASTIRATAVLRATPAARGDFGSSGGDAAPGLERVVGCDRRRRNDRAGVRRRSERAPSGRGRRVLAPRQRPAVAAVPVVAASLAGPRWFRLSGFAVAVSFAFAWWYFPLFLLLGWGVAAAFVLDRETP
jgi:hypothetical protein